MRFIFTLIVLTCLTTVLPAGAEDAAGEKPYGSTAHALIDWPMYQDPVLEYHDRERKFPEGSLDLWLSVLHRPELDYSIRAADAIGLAHRMGMADVPARATEPLIRLLKSPDRDRRVILGAARALVLLDARDAADALHAENLKGDIEMVRLTDPALAMWDHPASRQTWKDRLGDAKAGPAIQVSAIESLRIAGDGDSVELLLKIVQDRRRAVDHRLAAADALGAISRSGLESAAGKLAAGSEARVADRCAAAAMLHSHESDDAGELLLRLAGDAEPAVAGRAAAGLVRRDPLAIMPLVDGYMKSRDANLRMYAIRALGAKGDAASVRKLGTLLADVNPSLRDRAREVLLQLGGNEQLAEPVRQAVTDALAVESWQSLEQASLLAGQLDYEAAGGRLIELFKHPRHEVRAAATTSLRWLDVPDHFPAMLQRASDLSVEIKSVGTDVPLTSAYSLEMAQLFQAFGAAEYGEAEALMRKFVPKASFPDMSRCAAIWALGRLHHDKVDAGLASALVGRLNDVMGMEPEIGTVRRMAAVTLGHMKAASAEASLRQFLTEAEEMERISQACRWALIRITGEQLPPLTIGYENASDWFLVPYDSTMP